MRSYDQDSFDTDHPGRRGRHHDRPRGRGPGFGGPASFGFEAFAMGPGFGPARFARRGGRGPGRGRRGDVRNAILALLAEQPMNGYQLINEISERTNGLWSPSAGSVYPALGLLLDEGLIVDREIDGKRVHELTEAGRAYVAEHADELTDPWERVTAGHRGFLDMRPEIAQLAMAVQQVAMSGDENQIQSARQILDRARRDIYRLLAGDQPAA